VDPSEHLDVAIGKPLVFKHPAHSQDGVRQRDPIQPNRGLRHERATLLGPPAAGNATTRPAAARFEMYAK
jgi:hypothetical protein